MKRRIFVGDIQGCREELERLLEELRFDPVRDQLEPVGDFVNRGPDSLGVLRLAVALDAGGVLGNHDLHLLRVAAGERKERDKDTFGDVLRAHDAEQLLAWLAERPFVRAWDDVVCVHAGFDPRWEDPVARLRGIDPLPKHPDSDFCTRVRYCTPEGEITDQDWPPPPPPYAPWFEHWLAEHEDPRTVVYGHWARMGLVERPRLRGLDTGCVWGGALTAWMPDEGRYVRVNAKRAYAGYG